MYQHPPRNNYLFLLLLFSSVSLPLPAQKIGYVDTEMLFWYTPGYLSINDSLLSLQSSFQEKLEVKQRYAKSLLEEYYTGRSVMRPEQIQKMEEQLSSLNAEIEGMVQEAEIRLEWNRQRLQLPYFRKIDSIAQLISNELGYRYILNHTNSGQVSNILYGPDEHNLMQAFSRRLGFVLPENYMELYRKSGAIKP